MGNDLSSIFGYGNYLNPQPSSLVITPSASTIDLSSFTNNIGSYGSSGFKPVTLGTQATTPVNPSASSSSWMDWFGGAEGLKGISQLGGLALAGINSLYSIYSGNKALNLANKQFKFQSQIANANLNNSIKSYNNSLKDRLQARAQYATGDSSAYDDEIEERSLSR